MTIFLVTIDILTGFVCLVLGNFASRFTEWILSLPTFDWSEEYLITSRLPVQDAVILDYIAIHLTLKYHKDKVNFPRIGLTMKN